MMTYAQIATASLGELTDELAAAGWDSTQTETCDARKSVALLLQETASKYRFENGKLFILTGNAYRFCFASIYCTTKKAAIAAYEAR